MERPDSLIFDMDGTLWDGVEAYAQGFNDFFRHHGSVRSLKKSEIVGFMGMEERAYLEATLLEWPEEIRKQLYQEVAEYQYSRIQRDGGILFEGVHEGLHALSENFRLFIVSNCPALTIEYFMAWAGIRSWITDSIAHGSNYQPKHVNIRELITRHGLQRPVYVGDTDSDRKQAELVPLPFIFVDYGFGEAQKFDLRASSFSEFVAMVSILD